MRGVASRSVREIPVAVVDLETTGLYPGGDRIVEIAVVRVEPKQQPTLVLDTLVNPRRPVSATEIHGITDRDVAGAPTFEEVARDLVDAMSGCVLASYNVYFDGKFLQAELAKVGIERFPPHLCLMYLRPLLGLGSRCSLAEACQFHGVHHTAHHWAGGDALASARLWQSYTAVLERLGVRTFGDLARRKAYKFTDSFAQNPLDASVCAGLPSATRLKSRALTLAPEPAAPRPVDRHALLGEYWDELTAALADLEVTDAEIGHLLDKRRLLNLTADEVRWLHARAFAGILADVCQDKAITSSEAAVLHRLSTALRTLGWSPGDVPDVLSGTSAVAALPKLEASGPWQKVAAWFGQRTRTPS
ncbi:MAG: 3'-5' exonuclease [Chloroflexi bacterium]|nr:3'-5' exonuclease [Chloroflexota bacterium]